MKLTYTTLHELPLRNYIDCVVDNNLRSLLRYNIPYSKKLLQALFEELQKEYVKLSGNKEFSAKKAAIDSLNDMKVKLYLYSNALQLISDYDDMQNAMQYLNDEGFKGTKEQIIKRVTAEIKIMGIQIEAKESAFRVENPTENKKVTREDYARTIIATNKNGYKVDYDTTVADFIVALNLQKEEGKRMEQQMNKMKRR